VKVTRATSGDIAEAHWLFLDELAAGRIRHLGQPELSAAMRIPGWVARYEVVRPYPNQRLRVVYRQVGRRPPDPFQAPLRRLTEAGRVSKDTAGR
jgi:hypothetical protein